MSKRHMIALTVLLGGLIPAHAAEVSVVSRAYPPGTTGDLPVRFTATSGSISLATFIVTVAPGLPAPTVVAGGDQPNLSGGYVIVDPRGDGRYRITLITLGTPDMAQGNGETVRLRFNLDGVALGSYPVGVESVRLLTTDNTEESITAVAGGVLIVGESNGEGWSIL